MKIMTSNQIRDAFLAYFKAHQHTLVPSSSLVPINDATLLFTNSGMVQFKETFLGTEKRHYTRATSSQRCVRAGGKHNDLAQVGYTKRHHTFFEMLGNFSFGDYFKVEAIQFAWNFLTIELKIPKEKLWITVYKDDKESEAIWLNEIKINPSKFSRCGEKDNFWSMGDTGPCGPCTEIFYDHGEKVEGGPPGSKDQEGDRYTEIWNLVFMQYNRDMQGKLTPLPKPCVDTGMGLERVCAVIQGVHDNYDIDLFQTLLQSLSEIINYKNTKDTAMRVIVDHIRSACFLIMDGITPSNEGRGYVLRRIIRRASRYGFKLGQDKPFFYKLVPSLIQTMGDAYPQLLISQPLIEQVIEQEEKQFAITLSKGLKILDKLLQEKKLADKIDGELMFLLYDTYGFPPDLTIDIAKERNLNFDSDGFEKLMLKQREQSQAAKQFNLDEISNVHIPGETLFTGYEKSQDEGVVTTLLHDFKPVSILKKGEKGIVVLDKTPFYAESGGQIGDAGILKFDGGEFRVADTKKHGAVILHNGEMASGELKTNSKVISIVDLTRNNTKLNHSATHLLHEALRRVLGKHVMQKGSLVDPKKLRFDFSHPSALTRDQIMLIERMINQQIRENFALNTESLSLDQAKDSGAMALFSEKYADTVRVVSMGNFSKEICGGTHVARTGDIGLFKITSESACASGIRRIEAATGEAALDYVESAETKMNAASELLKTNRENLSEKITQLLDQNKKLLKELSQHKHSKTQEGSKNLLEKIVVKNNFEILIAELEKSDRDTLRTTVDQLKPQLKNPIILLSTIQDDKVVLISSVCQSALTLLTAPALLKFVAEKINGTGGGRPDLAQGGGDNVAALKDALALTLPWIQSKIK